MKILFVYPRFSRHAEAHPELREWVPMNEYLGSPSLGIAAIAAVTPSEVEFELRDDRLSPADVPTDADLVAFSFFTPAATRALELAGWHLPHHAAGAVRAALRRGGGRRGRVRLGSWTRARAAWSAGTGRRRRNASSTSRSLASTSTSTRSRATFNPATTRYSSRAAAR